MKCLSLPLILVVLVACQSEQTVLLAPSRAGKAVAAGKSPSTDSSPLPVVGNLGQSEMVKVYGIKRNVDAADVRVLHERHAVYRLEQQPAWITRSPRNQGEVILGPIVGLHKPEYAPEPVPGE